MPAQRKDTKSLIIDLLHKSEQPLGAYELIARLSQQRGKVAPTTVYRALSALIEEGRAHRVESKNAYMACQCDAHDKAELKDAVFSICGDCGTVEEHLDAELLGNLAALTARSGFSASRHVIEVHGRCADCAGGSA